MSRAADPRPRVAIVVARARNGVIGRDNGLAWHLPEDLQHFKATTLGHAIVMGRKTFESIGRPLPGRRTIVVTGDPLWRHEGCERADSLAQALTIAGSAGADPSIGTEEVFVVGGAQIYRQALPLADRLVVTEIDIDAQGDVHFPELPAGDWQETSRDQRSSASGLRFAIVEYRRKARPDPDPGR